MKFFLDTNICIYYLKGLFPKIKEKFLLNGPKSINILSIVKAELLYGAEKSKFKKNTFLKIKDFLSPYEIISFDNKSTFIYAKLKADLEKKGKIIGPNDLLIAASVIANNGILVTKNIKEFKRVKGLKLADWTK